MTTQTKALKQRITDYLSNGGLFNPELANHVSIRDLLIECREALAQPEQCTGCEGKPSSANNPCAVCGNSQPEQPKVRTGDCLLTGFCASEGHKIQKAEPEQEPVAYFNPQVKGGFYWAKPTKITAPVTVSVEPMPLYTTPPQRTWVGLTDEEDIDWDGTGNLKQLVEAVEAKLKAKNHV